MTDAVDVTDLARETVDGLLSTTRSVRHRLDLDRPVERSVVEECLKLALQAPSASNAQGSRWVLVDDSAKRERLAAIYAECWTKYRRIQERRFDVLDGNDLQALQRLLRSGEALATNLNRVPVIAIPCIEATLGDAPVLIEMASIFGSVFPAVWSFQLALRSRGLGSVLTTIHLWRAEEVARELGVPDGFLQCGLLPVAYTRGSSFRPAARRPVSEMAAWNTGS
jgi:nitroreductase